MSQTFVSVFEPQRQEGLLQLPFLWDHKENVLKACQGNRCRFQTGGTYTYPSLVFAFRVHGTLFRMPGGLMSVSYL
ncbi:hypothetical protein K435DRAFT_518284 [Dendrothele bispora CBS 962.96]|uniref:Uncharacterized protein n=1 Tax=Dendrothele bispora (strain CBS 962.96) TaxID=1314807 RepID=A0A4S8KVC6_DENBC|nr:hypothetical protein K435DRAFT_518284 [Dendrothele bispora CBS 962.96]